MSRQRQSKKQKIDPITITITIDECIQCNGCESQIYPMIEDYFIIDCEQHHSFCTACFAMKVKKKGCDHKVECCCRKREEEFTLMKTQLIEGALVGNYYDFVIEEEDENLDIVRKFSNTHPFPGFFSITIATRRKEHYGTVRNKQHKLLVNTAILTIDNASEWGDTITPLENIMKSFHSILNCLDSNNNTVNHLITNVSISFDADKSVIIDYHLSRHALNLLQQVDWTNIKSIPEQ